MFVWMSDFPTSHPRSTYHCTKGIFLFDFCFLFEQYIPVKFSPIFPIRFVVRVWHINIVRKKNNYFVAHLLQFSLKLALWYQKIHGVHLVFAIANRQTTSIKIRRRRWLCVLFYLILSLKFSRLQWGISWFIKSIPPIGTSHKTTSHSSPRIGLIWSSGIDMYHEGPRHCRFKNYFFEKKRTMSPEQHSWSTNFFALCPYL